MKEKLEKKGGEGLKKIYEETHRHQVVYKTNSFPSPLPSVSLLFNFLFCFIFKKMLKQIKIKTQTAANVLAMGCAR